MRRIRVGHGIALAVLALAFSATAALAGGYSVGVTGGLGAPMSEFKDAFSSGWTGAGMADYDMNPLWGVGVDLGYHTWKASDAQIAFELVGQPLGTTLDDKLAALQYGLHVTVTPPVLGPVRPYAQVGASAYNLKETTSSNLAALSGDFSKSLFGWNAGAGVNFAMLPTLSFGVDGHYHDVNSKKDFGSNATWFTVNGRLTFHIPLAK